MTTAWLKDVIGYGTHAARPAAGSAGALYYETDTDTLFRDNGATWDVLALGTVSPLTTKGDLWAFGSVDTRLPVGADGQVLTADSTQTRGVKWAAAGGGGAGALTKISETILSASAASINFTGIAATYRHLELHVVGRSDNGGGNSEVRVQFNGDTGTNYDYETLTVNGSSTPSAENLGTSGIRAGYLPGTPAGANAAGVISLWVYDYARTVWRKNTRSEGGTDAADTTSGKYVQKQFGCWHNTAAITSILVYLVTSNMLSGTVASLYGVA